MSGTKKFLWCLCFACLFFALGMAVRHIYDKYYLKLEPAGSGNSSQLHLVIEPAKELPQLQLKSSAEQLQ